MKLSIVTITYNNFLELKTTLETISGIQNTESVIINGGECQETLEYLNQHQEYLKISERDEGISDAFNKGIKLSTGDFITFLNSGDKLIDSSYYNFANNYFLKNPQVDYIYADIIFDHQDHGELIVKPNTSISKTPFPHPSLIVRKSVFEKIGGFDKNLKIAMDFDFMCNLVKGKFIGYYYQSPVVLMDGTGTSSIHGFKAIDERLLILERHALLDFNSKFYLKKLRFKMNIRNMLQKLNLLKTYDRLKKLFFKPKSE